MSPAQDMRKPPARMDRDCHRETARGLQGTNPKGIPVTQSIASTGFIRNIASIETDDEPIEVGAQLHVDDDGTERHLALLGIYGIDIEHLPALLEALVAAQSALLPPLKEAA